MWGFLLIAALVQVPEGGYARFDPPPETEREGLVVLPTELVTPLEEPPGAPSGGDPPKTYLSSWGPADASEEGLSVRAAMGVRALFGHTSVGETPTPGTRLNFHRDLGLAYESGLELALIDNQPSWEFTMEAEYLIGFGGRAVSQTFLYNGHAYTGPSRVRDHLQTLAVRPELALKLVSFPTSGAWLGPVLGLEYPYYLLSVKSNLEHNSLEDWTHFLPYPVLGAAGSLRLAEDLTGQLRVTGGYVPNLPVPFIEGGRLFVSARPTVFMEAPVTWKVSASLDLSAVASFQYWSGVDHSREDANVLTFSALGIMVGAALRW